MVPLDGSDVAERTLSHPVAFADANSGSLSIVQVVEPTAAVQTQGLVAPAVLVVTTVGLDHPACASSMHRSCQRLFGP